MTVEEMRIALRHPDLLDPDSWLELDEALHQLHPRYRRLLLLRAAGFTKREAMRLVGTRGGDDLRRAERALMKELQACPDE